MNNKYLELIRSQIKTIRYKKRRRRGNGRARCLKSIIKSGIKVKGNDAEGLFCYDYLEISKKRVKERIK